jgi:uncharacterized protein
MSLASTLFGAVPSGALSSGPVPTERYAPDFRVEVEGRELDPATKGDVLDLKVTMDMDAMTSADFNFNNWDDRSLFFKYSDTTALNVGNRIHVLLGYSGRLVSLMHGQINSLTPRFPQAGSPTITVSALDGMQLLKERRPKDNEQIKYSNVRDYQIAQKIAERHGLKAEVTEDGPEHVEVIQKNQDDAQFLMERAKRIDFDCYIHIDPSKPKPILRFMRPTDARAGSRARVHNLAWCQVSQRFDGLEPVESFVPLLHFEPTLTLSRQVSQVTVRGWDPSTKQAIVATARAADLPGGGRGASGPQEAERVLGGRQDVVVDVFVRSVQEAREYAIALLREKAYEFITASGEVMGMPELRPGDNVNIRGLGKRFSGQYYVKRVEHSLGSNGFTTRFEARAMYDGGVENPRRAR